MVFLVMFLGLSIFVNICLASSLSRAQKYDLTHTQLTKVVQYTSRLPTERTGMLM